MRNHKHIVLGAVLMVAAFGVGSLGCSHSTVSGNFGTRGRYEMRTLQTGGVIVCDTHSGEVWVRMQHTEGGAWLELGSPRPAEK